MKHASHLLTAAAAAAMLVPGGARLGAQEPAPDPASMAAIENATREELRALLAELESAATVPGASSAAFREAEHVRARLRDGDFQVGDAILLRVEGEDALSDTLAVSTERRVTVSGIGEIPLAGVLRSELEPHLTAALGQYLRDPVVHAAVLIRLGIAGEVQAPGFYVLPRETLLTEALMVAGGPTRDAAVEKVEIERGDRRLWDADAVRAGIAEGRTLAHFDLRPGDRLVVPRERSISGFDVLRIVLVAIPTAVLAITQF